MNKNSLLAVYLCLLFININAQSFSPVFNPAGTVTGSKAMVSGNFDGDTNRDIAVTSSIPNSRLVVFENFGNNAYSEVFTINAPAMSSLTYGDTDNDGDIEIIGSPFGSSIFQIVMYENTGNNQFVERVLDISEIGCSQCQLTKVMVADLDLDGKKEIVFSYKNSDFGTASKLYVYEHDTIAGVNHYSKVYEYVTAIDASIENFTIGDSDNDGQQEILLDIYNGKIVRLENNGNNSFVFKSVNFTTSMSMRDLHVADVDLDGDNELLIVGKEIGGPSGRIIIFESPADDQYIEDFVLDGIGTMVKRINTFSDNQFSLIALGTFNGLVDVLQYKNQSYSSVLSMPLPVSTAYISAIEMGFIDSDNKVDLLVSTFTGEGLYVYESDSVISSIDELKESGFQIWPNPAQDYIILKKNSGSKGLLKIFSVDGKLIKSYPITTSSQKMDISFLQSGSYILQYTSTEGDVNFSSLLMKTIN